jgi:hypothetical protein
MDTHAPRMGWPLGDHVLAGGRVAPHPFVLLGATAASTNRVERITAMAKQLHALSGGDRPRGDHPQRDVRRTVRVWHRRVLGAR